MIPNSIIELARRYSAVGAVTDNHMAAAYASCPWLRNLPKPSAQGIAHARAEAGVGEPVDANAPYASVYARYKELQGVDREYYFAQHANEIWAYHNAVNG